MRGLGFFALHCMVSGQQGVNWLNSSQWTQISKKKESTEFLADCMAAALAYGICTAT